MASKESVLKNMLLVADALQTGDISHRQMDIFYKAFLDISDEELASGCWSFIKSDETGYFNMRMPPPGIILKHVRYVSEKQKTQIELRAAEHWHKIVYDYSEFCRNPDPIALKALKLMGGKDRLRMMLESEEAWERKRFVEYYTSYQEKQDILELQASNDPPLENDKKTLQMLKERINAKKLTTNT